MKAQQQPLPLRERYRALVSLLIIPLGMIIVVRGAMFGIQAWTVIILGLAMIGLGVVRLRTFAHYKRKQQ
jgi:uncharacterized membrane protein YecN with MAPEG domain